MTLGSELADVLAELRAEAESLMLDTCKVERPDTSKPRDPITNERPLKTVYTGKAKSQTYEAHEVADITGGHQRIVQRYAAHFPAAAFDPQVGDLITWTASAANPNLVGKVDRVAAPFEKSLQTATRVFVDRVSA